MDGSPLRWNYSIPALKRFELSKEICDLAECGRSTFYMYYPYKDALYDEIIKATVDDILAGFAPLPQYRVGNELEHAEEYLDNVLLIKQNKRNHLIYFPGKRCL